MKELNPAEALAKRRFTIINAVRLGGIAAFLIGVATLADALGLPDALGFVLVAAGAIGVFLAPTLLARRWSTRAQNPRSNR